jgi:hypothetical protein
MRAEISLNIIGQSWIWSLGWEVVHLGDNRYNTLSADIRPYIQNLRLHHTITIGTHFPYSRE